MQIGDFGLSKMTTTHLAETIVGTPYFMAPEITRGTQYSFSSDVWSLGVIVYYMCTYQMPFNGDSVLELEEKVFVSLGPSLSPFAP
jgi:NIMA (never in mitosis gene a)-related kinase